MEQTGTVQSPAVGNGDHENYAYCSKKEGEGISHLHSDKVNNQHGLRAFKSTALSVDNSYNSPPSKPTKYHRQPTEIHRISVRIYVTSVNNVARQAAER